MLIRLTNCIFYKDKSVLVLDYPVMIVEITGGFTLCFSYVQIHRIYILLPPASVGEVYHAFPEAVALSHLQLQRVCRTQRQETKAPF